MRIPPALKTPDEGKKIEFWTTGMQQKHDERGILGWFKDGTFWSEDRCDHWSQREVKGWAYL